MADSNLTQAEADALITAEKRRIDATEWDYPGSGGVITIPLVSTDQREPFLWASPVPSNRFADLDDLWRTLEDFMRFCNIVEPPVIRRGLFI